MNDLKFAFRQLLKNPVITCVAILTLALGIGANTAILSVMNALMIRMLPVADPARLVLFGNGDSMGSTDGFPNGSTTLFSYPMFRELQRNNQVFSGRKRRSTWHSSGPYRITRDRSRQRKNWKTCSTRESILLPLQQVCRNYESSSQNHHR